MLRMRGIKDGGTLLEWFLALLVTRDEIPGILKRGHMFSAVSQWHGLLAQLVRAWC